MDNHIKFLSKVNEDFENNEIIGDIQYTSEERSILYKYFRKKYRNMISTRNYYFSDPIFAVALINIGIEYYDGNFWKHVSEILEVESLNPNHHQYIGISFFKTMKKYNKVIISEHEIVNSILMHAFVSNYFVDEFFEFLLSYYSIDLNRDISKNKYYLEELIKAIRVNDNTNRTYLIKKHTSDSLRIDKNIIKNKINKYIKAIDKYFWDKILIKNPKDRIDFKFNLWCKSSKSFNLDINKYSRKGRKNLERNFKKPFLKCDLESSSFYIVLPEEYIKDKKIKNVQWIIELDNRKINHNVQLLEGIIGFKTEKETIEIFSNEIFDEINIYLLNGDRVIKTFKIKKEYVRFIDEDGFNVDIDLLRSGSIYVFTNIKDEIIYKGFSEKIKMKNLNRYYLDLKEDDIVKLPNNNVISIGKGLEDGLLRKYQLKNSYVIKNNNKYKIYNNMPQLIISLEEEKIPGTFIEINNKKIKIKQEYLDEINYYENNDKKYYIVDLYEISNNEEGYYNIIIDIPNYRKVLAYNIVVIKKFNFDFEDSPYIFVKKGTITFNKNLDIRNNKNKKLKVENEKRIDNFLIEENQDNLRFKLIKENIEYEIYIDIPVLKWRSNFSDWTLDNPGEIWHEDMPKTLTIDYPEKEIKLSIETDQKLEQFESLTFSKSSTGFIECDLVRFYSWINNDIEKQIIYIDLDYIKIPFLIMRTSSSLVSYHLKGDFINNKIIGEFKIIGKSEYYLDIYYKHEKIVEKKQIINGRLDFNYKIKKGKYTLILYESENNYGFGEKRFNYNKTINARIIDPNNLKGECLEIKNVIRKNKSESPIELGFKYYIVNLKKHGKNTYRGIQIEETKTEKIFKKYLVEIQYENLEKIYKTFVKFVDNSNDTECFLYDIRKNKLVKKENNRLESSEKYRRYEVVFPEDFIFEIEFLQDCKYKEEELTKPKNDISDNIIKWIHTN